MKIVVLDGYTTTLDSLSFDALASYGELACYDYTQESERVERLKNAEIALTNKTVLDSQVLSLCPSLKYIGVLATGYNVVDIDYCRKKGIIVSNIPAYSTDSVAQLVFAHILEYCHHIGETNRSVKQGEWCRSRDFCYSHYPLIELKGKTLGIYGFGRIGRKLAEIAKAFGMKVIAYNRSKISCEGVEQVQLEDLLKTSDFISLNAPLTAETKHIINLKTLALVKPHTYIINTARGGLIDEDALAFSLENGSLAGVGLDVLSTEPPDYKNPLLFAPNVIITPHIAWATLESRERLLSVAVENVAAFLSGKPQNVVS